jgi:hypothetical protein
MLTEFKVGVSAKAMGDGLETTGAAGSFGQVLVSSFLPAYAELVNRGMVFSATTAAAGAAPGTATSTTPPFALWNPPNSGKNLVVLGASVSILSGTLGLGTVFLEYCAQTTQPSTGSELTRVEARIGGGVTGSGRVFQGSTLAATPVLLRAFCAVYAGSTDPVASDLSGGIVVLPGYALALEEIGAAGTSPKAMFSMTWAEVPA